MSFFGAHREAGTEILPSEGHLPPFEGATGWLNSEPLMPEGLRGRVVAVQFWTYTCVNWLERCRTCASGPTNTRTRA